MTKFLILTIIIHLSCSLMAEDAQVVESKKTTPNHIYTITFPVGNFDQAMKDDIRKYVDSIYVENKWKMRSMKIVKDGKDELSTYAKEFYVISSEVEINKTLLFKGLCEKYKIDLSIKDGEIR